MFAQAAPPACPADRPVDDIIAELHKQQAKKERRNKNPLPDVICIWGWCRSSSSKTPPTVPEPAPPPQAPSGNDGSSGGSSSSKTAADKCNAATEAALEAAHDVEVGDFYFTADNYKGALLRYRSAAQEKSGDAAIHVRLGRVFEKLNQVPQAIEQYKTAQNLMGPKQWSDEATAALVRLQPPPRS